MSPDTYALADHIRVCRTVFDTVGLDLRRGRYFALGEGETDALIRLGILPSASSDQLGRQVVGSESIIDALLSAGLLQAQAAPRTHTVLLTPASSAGFELQHTRRVRVDDLRTIIAAHRWARCALTNCSLLEISRQLTLTQAAASDLSDLIVATNVFRSVRPYLYSARGRCLLHALTLWRFLYICRLSAHWVMAVRTRPWAAHSWVQAQDCVLDARCDDVREYSPLLVV